MRTHRRALILGACLAIGAMVGLAVFLVSTNGGSKQTQKRDAGLLLTGNRTNLQVCIENLDQSATDRDEMEVAEALAKLSRHPYWRAAGLDKGDPVAVRGCDASPFLLSPGVKFQNGGFVNFGGFPEVQDPSPYRVMLFVLPDSQIDSLFGDSPIRFVGQEALCDKGQCETVTTGLYLKQSELNPVDLERALTLAVGLERPELTPGTEEEIGGGG